MPQALALRALLALGLAGGTGCGAVRPAPCNEINDEAPALPALAFLVGDWRSGAGDTFAQEVWLEPAGTSMLGLNRTVRGSETVAFEFLRIEAREDGITYLAAPGGRHPPTPFQLVRLEAKLVIFENPDHDFPQRVIYQRDGNELHARIEGEVDGEPQSAAWSWTKHD